MMNNYSSQAEPFDAGQRNGVYLVPRLEYYGNLGCGITFSVAEGDRTEAVLAHNRPEPFAAETVLVAPIYVSDAYRSADPHFALKVMHEFMMICCEQHELYRSAS